MLAASTGWNLGRRGTLHAAARELMEFGFDGVELRAKRGAPDAATCGPALRAERIPVPSAHAPLLATEGEGEALAGLSSADEGERARAVEALVLSARNARAAGTRFLVIHPGAVPVPGARERLAGWKGRVGLDGAVPAAVREEAAALLVERARLRDAAVEATIRSLHAACSAEPETVFCLECPLHLHEIPSLEEVGILLSEAGRPNLAFWLDTGHAAVQEALGGPAFASWLDAWGPRTAGAHLHDSAGLDDHMPPGSGRVDWARTLGDLPSKALRTVEVSPRFPREVLLEGLRFLRAKGE
jgi:sugar phosphate isomerase/epimerase